MRSRYGQLFAVYRRFLINFTSSKRGKMAEREGFEPSIRFCRILTFQASAFDHSATAPPAPGRVHTKNSSLEGRPCKEVGAAGQPCSFAFQAPMRRPCGRS